MLVPLTAQEPSGASCHLSRERPGGHGGHWWWYCRLVVACKQDMARRREVDGDPGFVGPGSQVGLRLRVAGEGFKSLRLFPSLSRDAPNGKPASSGVILNLP